MNPAMRMAGDANPTARSVKLAVIEVSRGVTSTRSVGFSPHCSEAADQSCVTLVRTLPSVMALASPVVFGMPVALLPEHAKFTMCAR